MFPNCSNLMPKIGSNLVRQKLKSGRKVDFVQLDAQVKGIRQGSLVVVVPKGMSNLVCVQVCKVIEAPTIKNGVKYARVEVLGAWFDIYEDAKNQREIENAFLVGCDEIDDDISSGAARSGWNVYWLKDEMRRKFDRRQNL